MIKPDSVILQNMLSGGMQAFLTDYKVLIATIYGFVYISCILIVGFNILNLSKSQAHPRMRVQCIVGLLVSIACLGLLTSIGVVYAMFLNLL